MRIIPRVVAAVETLLGQWAEEVNRECRVVRRQRKFSAVTLARTFVLGSLGRPRASDKELAEMAGLCGVDVTPQAIEQRFTPTMVTFLERLLRRGLQHVIAADTALAPLLERFTSVPLHDSTTIALSDELRDRFPGCGGTHGSGKAAMKIQLQWDLRSGAWPGVSIEAGRDCDCKTPLQTIPLPPGSLSITDLGFFDTAVFRKRSKEGVFWLSRLLFGTAVFTPQGPSLNLVDWLSRQPQGMVDQWIQIGTALRVACRLLAWRVPEEVANRRRQKLIAETQRKRGQMPTQERLAWCDWMILVTNMPTDMLTPTEALVLYRARWQIELLFKRWKSLGLVAELTGQTVVQQMVRLWSRLIAALLEHWLILSTAWGDPRLSLMKAGQLIRRHAAVIATAIGHPAQLMSAIEILKLIVCSTAFQNKRKRPSTFELLNNPELIQHLLT